MRAASSVNCKRVSAGSFKCSVPWLATIAHRKAIDRHRAAARAPVPAGALPDRPSPHGIPTEPHTGLWAAVRALPPKQRGAVAYHYLADLPYAEVGRLLGELARLE